MEWGQGKAEQVVMGVEQRVDEAWEGGELGGSGANPDSLPGPDSPSMHFPQLLSCCSLNLCTRPAGAHPRAREQMFLYPKKISI